MVWTLPTAAASVVAQPSPASISSPYLSPRGNAGPPSECAQPRWIHQASRIPEVVQV